MVGGIKVCQCHMQRALDKWDRDVVVGIAYIFMTPLVSHCRIVLNGYSCVELENMSCTQIRKNTLIVFWYISDSCPIAHDSVSQCVPSASPVHAESQTKLHLKRFSKELFCSQVRRICGHHSGTATSKLSQGGEDGMSTEKPV